MTKEVRETYLKWVDCLEVSELQRKRDHHKERLLILEAKLQDKKRVDNLQTLDTKKV